MTAIVSKEQVIRIVESVRRVPSGENCQPWTFSWDGKRLNIFHEPGRAKNRINYDDYVSYLSLGFLLENIQIAASSEGLAPKFKWSPQKKEDSRHWAEVEFEEHQQPDELFATLTTRFTDRRPFKKGNLRDEVFSLVAHDAERFQNCKLYFRDNPTREFFAYACKAESFFWTNKPFHKDYTRWIRLTKRETLATRDGLPWRSLGVNYLESRLLLICKPYKVQALANKLGFMSLAKKVVREQISSSTAICCLTVPSSNVENLIEAGRAGMRAWLRLNQYNYGFHPMSLSALIPHFYVLGVADRIFPGLSDLGREGESVLRAFFGYPEGEIPIWLFRTGITAGFPKQPLTLRLEIGEILNFENGV